MTPLMHLKRAVALFCAYANVLAFVFLGILQLSTPNPKRMHGLLWLSMGIGCILFFICTNCYPNYAHICFPFAIIALLELKRLYQESGFKKHVKALVASLTIFILAINLFNGVYRATQLILHDSSAQKALYMPMMKYSVSSPKKVIFPLLATISSQRCISAGIFDLTTVSLPFILFPQLQYRVV